VASSLDFDKDYTCSVFETTIRVMGGLLSAYDLSGDPVLLGKARQLADRLLPAWGTPSGVPWHYLNLRSGQGQSPAGQGWVAHHSPHAQTPVPQCPVVCFFGTLLLPRCCPWNAWPAPWPGTLASWPGLASLAMGLVRDVQGRPV